MKLRTFIALVLLLPALFPEAAALRAQSSRNSFPKVSVGDIRYVDKAHSRMLPTVCFLFCALST